MNEDVCRNVCGTDLNSTNCYILIVVGTQWMRMYVCALLLCGVCVCVRTIVLVC